MRVATSVPAADNQILSSCLDRINEDNDSKRPLSTYRLQFNKNFTFENARQLLPYLNALGVTHCYASPVLMARAGSQHGYDIINHNQINPEIGTEEEFHDFVRELKSLGMGLILDIVPNHMGIGHRTNPWWQDVLENGQASEYADFFDIDWRPLKFELHNKVLLPVLGGSYGEELEQGHIQLKYEDERFYVTYYDKRFPIDPATYPLIFDQVGDFRDYCPETSWRQFDYPELQTILHGFGELAPNFSQDAAAVNRRRSEIPELKRRLAELCARSVNVKEAIAEVLRRNNGNTQDARSFDSLHRVLEAQAYRLAHWRVSTEEINYRRFFDVNDLVGLRMENPSVFAATHKLLRKLMAEGTIDGLRMDHPDGLFNPVQYFTRVQMLHAASHCCGPEPEEGATTSANGIEEDVVAQFSARPPEQQSPLYLVVEKILEHGEQLPKDWPVDGTVGYEFGNLLNHLFINSRTQRFFRNFYHRFIGGPIDVNDLIYDSKKLIMDSSLSSEVTVLTHMLQEISSSDRRARDITRALLKDAIREVIACFPVYRTYIDARGTVSERDRGYILEAVARAKRRNTNDSTAPFDFLKSVLLLDTTSGTLSADQYRKRLRFTLKFQQLSGPVMAKGLEDTACYIYSCFISANEVGGSPASFGISQEEFHRANLERTREWTFSMLATSTHDSKRSEDVRARLNVLSEMPKQWSKQVVRWRRANRSKKRTLGDGRNVPDPNEEYFLYQTLVGVWPFIMNSQNEREDFTSRIQEYMTKAVHEAKVNLSWINQNQEYVDSLRQFIARILTPGTNKRPNQFLQELEKFLPPVMFFGCINGLAQVLLKITSPGVPDIYRGTETWDLSLVDPDNRRPLDYEARQAALAELLKFDSDKTTDEFLSELLGNLQDSRAKMYTTMRALRFRRDNPDLFRRGEYVALTTTGGLQEHVVAFARRHGPRLAITAVPRFCYMLMNGEIRTPLGADAWHDAELELPPDTKGSFMNVLTGENVEERNGRLLCREIFSRFPVALLAMP